MHNFSISSESYIETLACKVHQYEHPSGLKYCHIDRDSDEKSFFIAFKTLPDFSNGVAHILEHTTLCGSEKFPVADPFFAMLRRSVSTFMNAMTSSDWTCYPFATRNEKDFDNLFDIYMDAVFHPQLRYESFSQEGHRLEQDEQGKWIRAGVVYNEMIGANSSLSSRLWKQLYNTLFPGTKYACDSGGDPQIIPSLSHADLRDFHRSHYSPDNALAVSTGKLDNDELMNKLEQAIATRTSNTSCDKQTNAIHSANSEQRFDLPAVVSDSIMPYPSDQTSDADVVNIVWRLDDCKTPLEMLEVSLLENLLLGNAASPLRLKLEQCPLGKSLSPITGYGEVTPACFFAAGLAGVDGKVLTEQVVQSLDKAIDECLNTHFTQQQITTALDSIEFSMKDLSSSLPIGLEISLELLHPWIASGSDKKLAKHIDYEAELSLVRKNTANPDYIHKLLAKYISNNPHRTEIRLQANDLLAQQDRLELEQQVQTDIANLDQTGLDALQQQNEQHKQWMDDPKRNNNTVLPKVQYKELLAPASHLQPDKIEDGKWLALAPTNGIVHMQLNIPINAQMLSNLPLLPMIASSLSQVGVDGSSYQQTQQQLDATFGSLSSQCQWYTDQNQKIVGNLELKGKLLPHKFESALQMFKLMLTSPNFEEIDRIKTLIEQRAVAYQNNIWGNAHHLAMQTANFDLLSRLTSRTSGLHGRAQFKALAKQLKHEDISHSLQQFQEGLQQALQQSKMLVIAPTNFNETELRKNLEKADISSGGTVLPDSQNLVENLIGDVHQSTMWLPAPKINYCSYNLPLQLTARAPETAHLFLFAELVKYGWLHPKIREQGGAYGSGAVASIRSGLTFFSYRDPNCASTYQAFQDSITNVAKLMDDESFDSAKLVVINRLDSQGEITEQYYEGYMRELLGKNYRDIAILRENVASTTQQDIKNIAKKLLEDYNNGYACAIVDEAKQSEFPAKNSQTLQI